MSEDIPSEFRVPWNSVNHLHLKAFEQALADASNESAMQVFLEQYPHMLIQHLGSGFRHWVIPKKRLGAEHETDFLIAEKDATGYVWHAMELERPQAKLFTAKGDPTAALTHALRQISDWRTWLSRNRDYAARSRDRSGLGLIDIEPELEGLIIMGREADVDRRTTDRRRRLAREHRVRICTYDWLGDQARERLIVAEQQLKQNPVASFVSEIFNRAHLRPIAEKAVYDVFETIGSTTINITATRSEDWRFVYIDRPPNDEIEIALNIVYSSHWRRSLSLQDWHDWFNRVSRDVCKDYSLLITELEPDPDLKEELTAVSEGIWMNLRQPDLPSKSDLDILAYLPQPTDGQTSVTRITQVREIFMRHSFPTR